MSQKRFQIILADAVGPDVTPFSRPSPDQIESAAQRLGEADVIDVLDRLEALSREKDAAPDWDGDTHDDIARAQETLSALLCAMAGRYRDLIAQRLDGADHVTRFYLEEALR